MPWRATWASRREGRPVKDWPCDIAEAALAELRPADGRAHVPERATPSSPGALAQGARLAPRGIDREVVELMHRTHMGVDQDAENILDQTMRAALADGWGGSMLATDISDILFGTPSLCRAQVNLGVLKDDEVNLIVHGHEPTLSEMIVAASTDPELLEYAKSKGANGINLAGICCTANEVLMRHGIPPAGNFLSQELAIATGAVEAMVVDVQCIMQALAEVALQLPHQGDHHLAEGQDGGRRRTSSSMSTMPTMSAKEHRARRHRQLSRTAARRTIPQIDEELIAGFSHEYVALHAGGPVSRLLPPTERRRDRRAHPRAGRRRGLQQRPCHAGRRHHQDRPRADQATTCWSWSPGCAATGAAKDGYLRPEFMAEAGAGLREVCEAIGIPPVVHVGSCVDNSRILTILTQCATEGGLGEDISDLPAVGICPEYMSEKAVSIGTYCAASGAHVLFGVHNPVAGQPRGGTTS